MLEYFVRNRRGSISVMLSIILIAALSLNSSLIELAKYHSMKRVYKEMSENAAFSLLAQYDRDLYENFGFLALEQGVGNEELAQYLQMNLTGMDSGLSLNNADILADVTNVNVAGVYPLSQKDVYKTQMMEFGAYRAPLSLINNTLNIEDTLNALIEELQGALPMLEMFEEISGVIGTYVDTIVSLYDYAVVAEKCAEACDAYSDQLDSYNASLSEIDSFISSYESEENTSENSSSDGHLDLSGNSGKVKDENYEAQLQALKDVAAENAAALQEKIVDLEEVLDEYQEKMTEFQENCSEISSANMQAILSTAKMSAHGISDETMRDNTLNIIGMLEKNSDEGLDFMEDINDYMKNFFPDPQKFVEDAKVKLEEQSEKLGKPVDQLEQLEIVEEAHPANSFVALLQEQINDLVINMAVAPLGLVAYITKMIDDLADAVEMIVEGVGALNLACAYGMCDSDMNHTISGTMHLTNTFNPYAADEEAVNAKLAEAQEIGEMVDYPTSQLAPGVTQEMSALENAMNNLISAEGEFRTACGNLKASGGIGMLIALGELAGSLRNFISSIIAIIKLFVGLSVDALMSMIYQKLYATVYATEMFSNRVTDTGDESRLNGSSFFGEEDYADASKCFVQADAEYIYFGNNNEMVNQTMAFFSILMLRLLCNLSAVLTDDDLMKILVGLLEVPVIGWIAIVVIVVVKLFLEAWFDMIMMIYAKEDVDIIKLNGGYFSLSGDGVDDLKEMVEGIIENEIGLEMDIDKLSESGGDNSSNDNSGGQNSKSDQDSTPDFVKDYVEGLFKWGYKDHLFLFMLLFTPSNRIYDRTATLIETQLQQKKEKDGAAYTFTLDGMYTYIRVETQAEYEPLLPIPVIPGLNDKKIPIKTVHYSGY